MKNGDVIWFAYELDQLHYISAIRLSDNWEIPFTREKAKTEFEGSDIYHAHLNCA